MKNIHAYTETAQYAPAFVSIDAHEGGSHTVTVRNRRQDLAQIELTPESLAVLALDILEYYNALPSVTVRINGREHRLAGLGDSISYERLCHEAGVEVHRSPTVTYCAGPNGPDGTVTSGGRAPIYEGTVFNVMVTGNA